MGRSCLFRVPASGAERGFLCCASTMDESGKNDRDAILNVAEAKDDFTAGVCVVVKRDVQLEGMFLLMDCQLAVKPGTTALSGGCQADKLPT